MTMVRSCSLPGPEMNRHDMPPPANRAYLRALLLRVASSLVKAGAIAVSMWVSAAVVVGGLMMPGFCGQDAACFQSAVTTGTQLGTMTVAVGLLAIAFEAILLRRGMASPAQVGEITLAGPSVGRNNRKRPDAQRSNAAAALESLPHGFCMVNGSGVVVACNQAFRDLFGISAVPSPSKPLFKDLPGIKDEVLLIAEAIRAHLAADGEGTGDRLQHKCADGRLISVAFQPLPDDGWVGLFEDVTHRRILEMQTEFLAHHDTLTELANRFRFEGELRRAISAGNRHGDRFAVLCLDLDHFKAVNDKLGHAAGDEVLRAAARRLMNCVRESDIVARFGGDEFAILLNRLADISDAEILARRIITSLSLPFSVEGHEVLVGTSIGIALGNEHGSTAEQLLRSADLALYRAKTSGRNDVRFFDPAMAKELATRQALEADLRTALARDEFNLHYQPIVSLVTGKVCGYEALLRWTHPVRGLIQPGEFLQVAEQLGIMVEIGEWILHRACLDAMSWPDDLMVAVNVSAFQVRSGSLAGTISRMVQSTGFPAHRLMIEVTESVLLDDTGTIARALEDITAVGARISLDDFGTHYSSLNLLRQFRVHRLKFDNSFIANVARDETSLELVKSVIGFARILGVSTTAEGVECQEQLDKLIEIGFDEAQGFLFDGARPIADALRRMDRISVDRRIAA